MNVPLTLNNDIPEPNFYQMNDYKQVTNQSTCLGCLGTLVGIQIQQQNDSASIIQDFRRPNVYNIYATNCCGQPISLLPLFKSKERSLGFSFLIFGGQLQPLDLFVGNFGCKVGQPINNQQKSDFLSPNRLFLRLERKWQFSCACFNRPRLNVFYIENGQNKLLGYIEIPLFFISIGVKYLMEMAIQNIKFNKGLWGNLQKSAHFLGVKEVLKFILISKMQGIKKFL